MRDKRETRETRETEREREENKYKEEKEEYKKKADSINQPIVPHQLFINLFIKIIISETIGTTTA
jgi:hypothetical protein